MRNHLLTTVLAAGALLSLAGSARARETQLCGIKLGAQTSVILEDPRFGDPNRISPIYNLFRPPTQAAGGGPGMPGGSSSGGEMGGAAETGTENAGTFLQLLGQSSTGGGGGASSGGGMMSSGSGMGGYPGSGGSGYPGSGSSEGSGGMMGMAPAAVRPKQQYEGRIANTRPEIYASWIVIPPKMRTIIMMGMSVAMGTAGAQGGMGGASSGGMGGSGSGSMMAPGGMMGGSEGGSGGMMGGGAMSASQQAVAKIPGAPGAGGMGGGASSMGGGGGGQTDPEPIANAWVYEKPADGMTYLFFADGGRVSLIAAGDDKPYSIAKGGRKPVHPGIQTSKGIGLGDTYDKVILTYGWPEATETMGDEIVLRYFGRQGVAFSFKNGVLRVDSIVVKLPGE